MNGTRGILADGTPWPDSRAVDDVFAGILDSEFYRRDLEITSRGFRALGGIRAVGKPKHGFPLAASRLALLTRV